MKVKSLLKAVIKSNKEQLSGRAFEAELGRALTEPARYTLHHLGSMPVDEEAQVHGKRYRDGLGASAVRTIVVMAKSAHNKGVEVHLDLDVSTNKIRVQERRSQKVLVDAAIQRVCFCTCDGVYNKVFAFIFRVPEKEVMECHAFYCGAPQVAQSVAVAMNGAFMAALEREQRFEEQLRSVNAFPVTIPIYPSKHRAGTGASASTSSACSSAGSTHSRSADSGASGSLRSGSGSGSASAYESEADSASLNSTRSANYSADSANFEQITPAELVDKVARQFARDLVCHADSHSEAESHGSHRRQLIHTAQVHAPPSTDETCKSKKCWSSTDNVQDECIAPLRSAANFSCVLPVPATVASS